MRTLHPTVAVVVGLFTLFVGAPAAEAVVVVSSGQDRFPVPGSIYESDKGTTYPSSTVPTEMVSMSLTGAITPVDSVALPPSGETFQVDSFFDVFTELRVGGTEFVVDSFFDVFFEITGGGGDATGVWETEMVSMSLRGDVGGIPLEIRESPQMRSTGLQTVTDIAGPEFQVDSFFDVFTEISIGGGPFIPAASPVRLHLTGIVPEPTSAMLVVTGVFGLLVPGRRKARR